MIQLPELPYTMDALAPAISADTLRHHWGRHHKAYVATINELTAATALEGAPLHVIIEHGGPRLQNAGAQAYAHAMLWQSMTPRRTKPSAALADAIDAAFGSRALFQQRFKQAAMTLFGSGWLWLVRRPSGHVDIAQTPNAGMRIHCEKLEPLLVCDLWEHAYYLDYQSNRARYVDAFFELIDWRAASDRFASCRPHSRLSEAVVR